MIKFMPQGTSLEVKKEILGEGLGKGLRLACQTKVLAAGTVFIPPGSRPEQVIALEESFVGRDIELKPAVRQLFLQVPEPTLDEPTADGLRLLQVLQQHIGKQPVDLELATLKRLPNVLRDEKGKFPPQFGRTKSCWT